MVERKKSEKCRCNMGMMLVSVVLYAAGVFSLFWGIMSQIALAPGTWSNYGWWALLYYLIAFILFGVGKIAKMNAGAECSVHC